MHRRLSYERATLKLAAYWQALCLQATLWQTSSILHTCKYTGKKPTDTHMYTTHTAKLGFQEIQQIYMLTNKMSCLSRREVLGKAFPAPGKTQKQQSHNCTDSPTQCIILMNFPYCDWGWIFFIYVKISFTYFIVHHICPFLRCLLVFFLFIIEPFYIKEIGSKSHLLQYFFPFAFFFLWKNKRKTLFQTGSVVCMLQQRLVVTAVSFQTWIDAQMWHC